jgi:hypothetical protein
MMKYNIPLWKRLFKFSILFGIVLLLITSFVSFLSGGVLVDACKCMGFPLDHFFIVFFPAALWLVGCNLLTSLLCRSATHSFILSEVKLKEISGLVYKHSTA